MQLELTALDRRLAQEDHALDEQAELEQVLAQVEELGYDAAAHEAARRAVTKGQGFAERRAQLSTAKTGVEVEQTVLERVGEAEQRWREQVEAARGRRAELEQRTVELQRQIDSAATVNKDLQRVRGEEAAARQRLGATQQRLTACTALERQQTDKLKRREALAAEASVYDELRAAFGVRGVPAMVIEAAMPGIEAEANRLLARMTGGRMHVRFDTQREAPSETISAIGVVSLLARIERFGIMGKRSLLHNNGKTRRLAHLLPTRPEISKQCQSIGQPTKPSLWPQIAR